MTRWLFVLLCGCQTFWGLNDTRVAEEGPRVCPPIGETPMYTQAPTFVSDGSFIYSYTVDEARTLAVGIRNGRLVEGAVDSDDMTVGNVPSNTSDVLGPRLAPEGDELFLRRRVGLANDFVLERYTRSGAAWVAAPAPNIALGTMDTASTPTRRDVENGRRIVIQRGSTALEEFREVGGMWMPIRVYSETELGVDDISSPQLSADGLRLIFNANDPGLLSKVRYIDRVSPVMDFQLPARTMFQLSGNTSADDPFMTTNCSRLYYTAFPGLTYVQL